MRALFLAFLPVLVGLQLAAQQPGSAEMRFWQALRRSSQPYLLVFEDESKPLLADIRKLLQEEGIADLGLMPMPLSQRSSSELHNAALRRFSLAPGTRWAVVDPKEQCLASGQAVPTPDAFAQQLAEKGIKSPIRGLRDFLKNHPAHLEARIDLLKLQYKSAGQRTRAALGLEAPEGDAPQFQGSSGTMMRMRTISSGGNVIFGRPKPEAIPKDKVLGTEQDLKIWGGYAESFDRLTTGDDWIAGRWNFDNDEASLEICSPLVKGLYKRKIKQIEAALERAPGNAAFWSVWIRMADVVGGQSIQAVVDRLKQQPGNNFASWPAAVRNKLIEEARVNKKWNYVVDNLWGEYEAGGYTQSFWASSSSSQGGLPDILRQLMDEAWSRDWETLFEPLLESLIHMDDLGRADAIMNTLRERQERGQWSETQMQKAIALANKCKRPDVAKRWSIYLSQTDSI
jgi:hypothetical protein